MKQIDLSKEKIRYVALGDSISEGYNGKYNFGYAGNMDIDKNISGTSWPAFLARNIQKIDKNILESYDNFAMSGTRPEDWNYFLGVDGEKYSYKNSVDKINYSLWLNELKHNPERRRLKKQFKNFGKTNKSDFDFLIRKIKEANLITINIGANYIIPKIPIDKIVDTIINYQNSTDQLKIVVQDTVNGLKHDVNKMIERIKEINNNASIYLIGYNKMYGTFWEITDLFFKKIGINEKIVEYCYEQLNESIKDCAKKNDIYYISTNNNKFWSENSYMMCNVFYEAHPTIFGYKKIAQDVLAKISLSNSFFNDSKKVHKIPTFNDKYIKQDLFCFKNSLDFSSKGISDEEIINKIYGSNNENLFKKTKIENSSKFLETSLFFEQTLDPKNDPEKYFSSSIKRSILIILNSLDDNFDKKAINDFNELFRVEYLNEFIIKLNLISVIANKIQNKVDKHFLETNKNITVDEFFNIFFEEILNFDFITWVLVEFAIFWTSDEENNTKLNKLNKNKKTFMSIFNNLLSKNKVRIVARSIGEKLINYLLLNRIGASIDGEYLSSFIDYITSKINFVEFGQIIFNFYFSSINEIKYIKNTSELLELFLYDEKINNFLHKSLKIAISSIKINSKSTLNLMKILNIPNKNDNFKKMKLFFNNIISAIVSETNLFADVIAKAIIDFTKMRKEKITLQDIIEFLLDFDKKTFWSKFNNIKVDKLDQQTFNIIVEGFDLIFSNIKYEDPLYKSILNLTNPQGLVNNGDDKIKVIKLLKFFDKLSKLKKPMSDFCVMLISNYYVSNNKSKKNNVYYKVFFRILLISILITRQLFQKNIKKNYFMDGKMSIVRILFQIAGYKHGKNSAIDDLMLDMFKEKGNYDLIIENNKFDTNQILRIIYFLDKKQVKDNVPIDKPKIIFEALKKGYID
ncbi:MAG: SGNH/GDSL hydrolase family protein [Mycoplasma sp.]|nr:SGNH/GDSL hydrolase family protein [Mycoplasma sp.]